MSPGPAARAASGATSCLRPWGLGAAVIGLLLVALPPVGFWPAACLLPWPFALLAREAPSGGRAFGRGWLAGIPYFGLGTLWLGESSWLNLTLVALVAAGYLGLLAWALRRAFARGAAWWPLLPLLWIGQEMLRLRWPLDGYPWLFVGHALAASPLFVQVADLGGVLLVSFVGASVAAGLLALRDGQRRAAAGAAGVVLLAAGYGLVRPGMLPEPVPGPLLGCVQPGFPQRLKDNPASSDERYATCMELSWELLEHGGEGPAAPGRRSTTLGPGGAPLDLLVWPETSWPYPLGDGQPGDVWFPATRDYPDFTVEDARGLERDRLQPLTRRGTLGQRAAPLLLGSVWRWTDADGRLRLANSAVAFDAEGRRSGRVDKSILVPGGETVPFKRWLPESLQRMEEDWIRGFAGWVVDLTPGEGLPLLDLAGRPYGVTICYENAYGDRGRRLVAAGAAFLVNLSNEAWFGTTTEFDQMELQSVLRAVETRRALFRSTNSGISCLVRPDGHPPAGGDRLVVDGHDRAVAGTFAARVPVYTGTTPYVRFGDWPGWLALLAAAWAVWRGAGGRAAAA